MIWGWLFSKRYLFTKIAISAMIPWLLFLPVEPWIPEKGELHELVGQPKFERNKSGEKLGTAFSIDNETLHCIFTSKGGFNGCKPFKESINEAEPIRATYFLMHTYYGMSSKMLNSLEQEGRVIVTPEKLHEMRITRFQEDEEFSLMMTVMFIILFFLARMADRKALETPQPDEQKEEEKKERLITKPEEPVSGLRYVFSRCFSKDYGYTRSIFYLTVAWYIFMKPVAPWMPTENELYKLYGKPEFKYFNTKSMTNIRFTVDGITVHCSYTGRGGFYGCSHYEKIVDTKKNVMATYFWLTNSHGLSSRMLHTVTQDGKIIISSEMTYKERIRSFNSSKKFHYFYILFLCVLSFVLWLLERRNVHEKLTQTKG